MLNPGLHVELPDVPCAMFSFQLTAELAQEGAQEPEQALAAPADVAAAKLEVAEIPHLLRALGIFLSQVRISI